jgi:cytochrome c oxidase assembly protein subunit 15
VFAIPFLFFWWRKYFKPSMVQPLIILFLLGAIQGAIGWIMVASGLTGDAIYVKPTRLALHFVFALGLLAYTFWFALQLLVPAHQINYHPKPRKLLYTLLFLLTIQLVYGAFMAGGKAATAAPTWPDINGQFIPNGMSRQGEGLLNLVDNPITVHFIHRGLGYILLIGFLLLTVQLHRLKATSLLLKVKWVPLLLVFLQVALGILSVLTSTSIIPGLWGSFEWMAQLHQLVAMLLLLSLVTLLYLIREKA